MRSPLRPIEFGSCAVRNIGVLSHCSPHEAYSEVPRRSWAICEHLETVLKTHLTRNSTIVCLAETVMIKWAIIFFIVSLVAGFFGFSGVAEGSKAIAKIFFYVALAMFLIVLVFGVMLGMLVF
jgi:uncharacterized membrane protein YtjA (UPF0391 family)